MDIWMKGTRFFVRDESGRDISAILADISAKRGLGAATHSMEEIMDVWSQSRRSGAGRTELYGDVATAQGLVCRTGQDPWCLEAQKLAPAAEQIIAGEFEGQLERRGENVCLGRPSTEYHGFLEGEDQGVPYKSEVTRVVSPPYLLCSYVRDIQNADHYYTREIIALEEGAVADQDLTPPE